MAHTAINLISLDDLNAIETYNHTTTLQLDDILPGFALPLDDVFGVL